MCVTVCYFLLLLVLVAYIITQSWIIVKGEYPIFERTVYTLLALKDYSKIKPLYVIRNLLRYIINAKHCISSMQSIVYHQGAGDYARWCVMRYSPKGTDDIPFLRSGMIYQACGLDTKKNF